MEHRRGVVPRNRGEWGVLSGAKARGGTWNRGEGMVLRNKGGVVLSGAKARGGTKE